MIELTLRSLKSEDADVHRVRSRRKPSDFVTAIVVGRGGDLATALSGRDGRAGNGLATGLDDTSLGTERKRERTESQQRDGKLGGHGYSC